MGQKDPLVEWQREGFEMFGALMKGVAQDFVRYVMHVEVVRNDVPAPVVQNVQQSSADDVQTSGFASAAQAAAAAGEIDRETWRPRLRLRLRRSRHPSCSDEWSKHRLATHRAHVGRARSSSSATARPRDACVCADDARSTNIAPEHRTQNTGQPFHARFHRRPQGPAPPPRRGGDVPQDHRQPGPPRRARVRGVAPRSLGRPGLRQEDQR